ncbi:MAG: T9SS type A sorting domain-containing protein [Flavobacteriales bacterium]
MWPVPFTDRFTVELPREAHGPIQLTLYDAMGRAVLTRQLNGTAGAPVTLDVSQTTGAGAYVLRLGTNDQRWTLPVLRTE